MDMSLVERTELAKRLCVDLMVGGDVTTLDVEKGEAIAEIAYATADKLYTLSKNEEETEYWLT